ncbi:hypothetical protein [Chlorella virus XW01]|nr:hypothetical protein [Chlorella virus XW01]
MIKESQLTTLLLLVLVGFLVYKLTAPVDLKNEGSLEKLSESDNVEETDQEREHNESEEVEAQEEAREEAQEEAQEEVEAQEENVVRQESRPDFATRINAFRGLESGEEQASLENAFERPIESQKQKPEEIDFNKNVVKKYDSKDYLPREVNDEWFDTDFSKAKIDSKDDKMIPTNRYVIGVNTVGQSLKNASYDIRGTVPNPKYTVSPWNNSTYEPDYNIKPLC